MIEHTNTNRPRTNAQLATDLHDAAGVLRDIATELLESNRALESFLATDAANIATTLRMLIEREEL